MSNDMGDLTSMAKTTQTRNGKGFEYACLKAIKAACTELTVKIDERDSPALNSAKNCFESLETQEQRKFCIAAQAPIPFLMDCEPNLNDADDPSLLSIGLQSDSEGQAGDVRDVLLYRVDPKKQTRNWECGISCKHNHDATKHPRINFKPPVKDLFATSWAPSFTMQQEYFGACEEVYELCKTDIEQGELWTNVFSEDEIASCVYKPINRGLMHSIDSLKTDSQFVYEFFTYCMGTRDFYKIIMQDKDNLTRLTVFNFSKTLGAPSKNIKKGRFKLNALPFPKRIISVAYVSDSTFHVNFDEGWAFSFRLHNADSKMKAVGLKYDIRLIGVPLCTANLVFRW